MAQPTFFEQPPSSTLAEIAALTKAHLVDPRAAASRSGGWLRSTKPARCI
jgi:UDP-3-O-[3-hydroxymyristoyl] glucosamine N-acyltransferase